MRITGEILEINDPNPGAKHAKELVVQEADGGRYRLQVSTLVFNALNKSGIARIGHMLTGSIKGSLNTSKTGVYYNNLHLTYFEK